MANANTGGLLVYDNDNKLAGIFTERDYLTKIVEGGQSATNTKIEEIMTPAEKLVNARTGDTINNCRQLMAEYRVRHLPVVDESGNAVGLVSMRDIINVLNEDQILNSKFFGQNIADVAEQAQILANLKALEGGEEKSKQDVARTGFVVAAAVVGAALLQGDWVRDHSWTSMSITFLLGYVGIVFENLFEFNKAAIALLMCVTLWVIYAGTSGGTGVPVESAVTVLGEKVSEVSEVVFFLMGAMTIVEIVDAHQGFKVVTDKISANNKRGLMWVVGILVSNIQSPFNAKFHAPCIVFINQL
jgi:predicted transcriptional regulator